MSRRGNLDVGGQGGTGLANEIASGVEAPAAVALTIAGSDSGGGAGIQADLKTFSALGVFGLTAITAITAQNTLGVRAVQAVEPAVIAAQIDAVVEDFRPRATKTGMLGAPAAASVVSERIGALGLERLVVDPVMVSKSGHDLIEPEARSILASRLLPLALVVTPNAPEASALTGVAVSGRDTARKAARILKDMGAKWVVIKGGHLPPESLREGDFELVCGDEPEKGRRIELSVDYVYDGESFREIASPVLRNGNTHGTGCVFSAAAAAFLAKGSEPLAALRAAKAFVSAAIAGGLPLGSGVGPANPMTRVRSDAVLGIPVYERVC